MTTYKTDGQQIFGSVTGSISGSTVYIDPSKGQATTGGSADVTDPANGSQQWCMKGFGGGAIKGFKVWTNVQPTTGNAYVMTFVKGTSAQSVTATIDDAHTSAKDITNSFTFTEDDLIALKVHQTVGGDTFSLGWCFWLFPVPVL